MYEATIELQETVIDFVQFNVLRLKGYGELIDLHLMIGSRNESLTNKVTLLARLWR